MFFLVFGFLVAHVGFQFSRYFLGDYPLREILSGLFDVNEENSLPTVYSVYGLLVSSILLGLVAYATSKIPKARYINHWYSLSFVFLLLSIDEANSLHEILIFPVRTLLNTSGALFYAWVIPGSAFVFVFLLVYRRFILDLPRRIRQLFLLSGTIFISGTIGLELIGGFWHDSYGVDNFTYAMIVAVEEFLEMAGILVFIYSLLLHLSSLFKTLQISFEN